VLFIIPLHEQWSGSPLKKGFIGENAMADFKGSNWLQVLDAPSLQDDFYLNLVDWSSQNVLAVGLGTSVYLWSASNSKVSLMTDLQLCRSVV